MSDRRRRIAIGRPRYAPLATVEEGQSLSFYAGRAVAVEKMDRRPGGTEFDVDARSRRTTTGGASAGVAGPGAAPLRARGGADPLPPAAPPLLARARPFARGDVIFDSPGIFQRLGNMLGIGG